MKNNRILSEMLIDKAIKNALNEEKKLFFSKKHINESEEEDNYTHFAVNKNTNLIVNGWNYSDQDPEELRRFKKDYFMVDLIDNEFDPKQYKILTRKGCIRQGINPDDQLNNWSNNGEVSLAQEQEQNNL